MASIDLFRVPDLIMKKRNGLALTKNEIEFFINSLINHNKMDSSQIGAMLMAIFFRGMDFNESYYLTKTMMNSGDKLNLSNLGAPIVDKHSTGGVGDKISLPLAPCLIACGCFVPMISGRGLGWTGGTLDKLESVPGLTTRLSKERIEEMVRTIGGCIVGQTSELNPADRILYSTRDITATVDCIPLIASSIVSKKAIECLDALVLDVKYGKAAFLKNLESAEELANYMAQISKMLGIKAGAFLTNHDNPYGRTIGNQIEVEETIECLHGNIPKDIEELVTQFGGYLLKKVDLCQNLEEGEKMILDKMKNGDGLRVFKQMLIGQGVEEAVATELCDRRNYTGVFKTSKYTSQIRAKESGFIQSIDPLELGIIVGKLGAGRQKSSDVISYEVGMRLLRTVGEAILVDEPWLEVYHNSDTFSELFENQLCNAVEISQEPVETGSLVLKIIEA